MVTGASSGIGLATAVQAAQAGWRVVATVRDLGRTEALTGAAQVAGVELDVRRLDVTQEASVSELVDGVVATYGGLDALVNNAGAAHLGTIELDTVAAVRDTFEVNFFGVVAMTHAAMQHLRAAGGALITISSVGGIVGQPFNEAYCAAKFAVRLPAAHRGRLRRRAVLRRRGRRRRGRSRGRGLTVPGADVGTCPRIRCHEAR